MILYLDASALAKLYIQEAGSDAVLVAVEAAGSVTTSRVTYAEVRAALARARRNRRLGEPDYSSAVRGFDQRWETIVILEVSQRIVRDAGGLAERHPLWGFDAIHLASALDAKAGVDGDFAFGTWDSILLAAARAEGLDIA